MSIEDKLINICMPYLLNALKNVNVLQRKGGEYNKNKSKSNTRKSNN